jgi:hypothetical protein
VRTAPLWNTWMNSYAARAYGNIACSTGSQASCPIRMKTTKRTANGSVCPKE